MGGGPQKTYRFLASPGYSQKARWDLCLEADCTGKDPKLLIPRIVGYSDLGCVGDIDGSRLSANRPAPAPVPQPSTPAHLFLCRNHTRIVAAPKRLMLL